MNYQCQNPSCDNREAIGERSAKKHNHKCEDCGTELVRLDEAPRTVIAGVHASTELRDLVGVLPTMMALPLAEYLDETRATLKLWGICDFTELSLRMLVIMGIAENRDRLPAALVAELAERIERPTLGQWLGMAQAIARHLPAVPLLPELGKSVYAIAAILGHSGDKVESGGLALRNLLAHGGGVRKAQAEALFRVWESRMLEIAAAVTWMKDIDILGRENDGSFRLMKGPVPATVEGDDVPQEPVDALWLRRGGTVVGLWPLGRFAATGSDDSPSSDSAPQLYIRRGEVRLQYSNFGGVHPVSESGATALESFLRIFRTDACPFQQAFSVLGFEAETRKEAERLIGRAEELEQLRIAVHAMTGGLLWLGGPAGMGKSCLLAALSAELLASPPERTLVLVYRFRTSDERCSRDTFCRFVVERLEGWDGLKPPDKELSETATIMEHLRHCIGRISDGHCVMFLVDGLDEIAERDPRFHQEIPFTLAKERVSFVCAGRPERGLTEVFRKGGAVEPFVDGLPRMKSTDVRAMLMDLTDAPLRKRLARRDSDSSERVANPFIDRVSELAEGLPLYVRYAAGDIISGKLIPEAAGQLPAGLHKYHEELLRRCAIGDLQAVLTPIVALLALAYEPLTIEQLAALLVRRGVLKQPDRPLMNRVLGGITTMVRRTLTPAGVEGYTVFHHSLSQHIIQSKDMAQTVAVTRVALADAAISSAGDKAEQYLYRCGIRHLLADGKVPEAVTLLTKFDYVMARFQALGGGKEAVAGYYQDWSLVRATGSLAGDPEIWWNFLRSSRHLLMRSDKNWGAHKILLQLAVEHADDSPVTKAAESFLDEGKCNWRWLRNGMRAPRHEGRPYASTIDGVHNLLPLIDGSLLTVGDQNRSQLWSSVTGDCVAALPESGERVPVRQLANGQVLFAGGGHLQLWDTTAQRWVIETHEAVPRSFEAICHSAFLELADGRYASWNSWGTITVWTASWQIQRSLWGHTTPEQIAKPDDNFSTEVIGLLELPGSRLLSWGRDGTLRIWDTTSGAELAILRGHRAGSFQSVVLVSERYVISSASRDSCVRRWDTSTGECLGVIPHNSRYFVNIVSLSGGRVVSSGQDDLPRVWDACSGELVRELHGHSGVFCQFVCLPGDRIAGVGNGFAIWDLNTGDCLAQRQCGVGLSHIIELQKGLLLAWNSLGAVCVWDSIHDDNLFLAAESGSHGDTVISKLPGNLVFSYRRPTARITVWSIPKQPWECSSPVRLRLRAIGGARVLVECQPYAAPFIQSRDSVRSALQISPVTNWRSFLMELPRNGLLAWAGADTANVLGIWSSETGLFRCALEGHTDSIYGAICLQCGQIVTWSRDRTLRTWEASTGRCLSVLQGHTAPVNGALEIPGGRVLSWAGQGDNSLRLWDTRTGLLVAKLDGHEDWVDEVVMLQNGLVASRSFSNDHNIYVWEADRGISVARLVHEGSPGGFIELRDGRLLSWSYTLLEASDRTNCNLQIWDVASGRRLTTMVGHSSPIEYACELSCGLILSRSGTPILGKWDGSVRLWAPDTGCCIGTIGGPDDVVVGVLEIPSDRFLTWGYGPAIKIWCATDGQLLGTVNADCLSGQKKVVVVPGYGVAVATHRRSITLVATQAMGSRSPTLDAVWTRDVYWQCDNSDVPFSVGEDHLVVGGLSQLAHLEMFQGRRAAGSFSAACLEREEGKE